MTTATKKATEQQDAPLKENLHVYLWQSGAVYLLKNTKSMGLHEFDNGLAAYLDQGGYHRLPGGVEPLETWVSDTSPSRYTILAHYPHYENVVLVFQIQDRYGYESFMGKYAPVAPILPEVVIEKPMQATSNVITEHRPRPAIRW